MDFHGLKPRIEGSTQRAFGFTQDNKTDVGEDVLAALSLFEEVGEPSAKKKKP